MLIIRRSREDNEGTYVDPQQPSSLMKILDAYADPPTPPPDNDGLRRALSTFSRENVPTFLVS